VCSAHKPNTHQSHWPLRTTRLMDVNRPRLPPDLHRTTQYKRWQEQKKENPKHQTPNPHKPTHATQAHATEPSSAPIGASSLSQAKTPSNEEQQLALARFILTGAQNHGAASFCSCAWQAEETTTTTGEWCRGHEPLTDAQRSGGSSLFLVFRWPLSFGAYSFPECRFGGNVTVT
jgi:hypothetical protein